MQITVNPGLTTVAGGTFSTSSTGYIQGTALNDPAIRNELSGGILNPSALLPMWGGCAIYEDIPVGTSPSNAAHKSLGGVVDRATGITGAAPITGFSVFDQDHSMINSPQSEVPLAGASMDVHFYRLNSGARIAVAMDPALLSLEGTLITSQVSWDFSLQRIIPFVAAYPANVMTATTWAASQVTFTTTTPHGLAVGSDFTVTGSTPAGYNGTYTALAGTVGSTIVAALAANPGPISVEGTLVAGGGACPCRVLDVQQTQNMTVNYDPVTGFATWNRNGAAAIILI